MNATFLGIVAILGLFLGMLLLQEIGRRLGMRQQALDPGAAARSAGPVEGAVFGLMALLIAFTFSGAATRFETRRQLTIEEANNIGTAWLRLDLLPSSAQPPLRDKFRQYIASRLAFGRALPDVASARAELARTTALQQAIWTQAVTACHAADTPQAALLLLPALNQMIDITTTRTGTIQMHPPVIIYVMLAVLVLAGSLLAGHAMATARARDWFHMLAYAVFLTLAIYVILDFEFPRLGLIRIDAIDQVLVDVQQSMQP